MFGCSRTLKAVLGASHRAISYIQAVDRHGRTFAIPSNTGSATIDATATPWGSLKMDVSDSLYWPTGNDAVLAPYGTVLLPFRGAVLPPNTAGAPALGNGQTRKTPHGGLYLGTIWGTAELCPLGQFRVTASELQESAKDGTVVASVTAKDFTEVIKRNLFVDPFTIAGGTRTSHAILAILRDRFHAGVFPTMPRIHFINKVSGSDDAIIQVTQNFGVLTGATQRPDPWTDLLKLAASIGAWLFTDARGNWVLEPIPEPRRKSSVWKIVEGNGGTLLGADRTLDDEKTHNGIILTCHHRKIKPFRVEVWDTNPHSATYYLGPFGKSPKMVTTKLCATHAQAMVMARSLFKANCGFTDTVSVTCPPMPAIEIGDVVTLKRARLGIDEPYVVDGIVVPFNIDSDMTVTMRPQAAFLK